MRERGKEEGKEGGRKNELREMPRSHDGRWGLKSR